jgi:hypothetical protein
MSDDPKPVVHAEPIDLEYLEALDEMLSDWNSKATTAPIVICDAYDVNEL